MRKIKFFAALCCAVAAFAACEKNDEPKNDTKEAVDLGLSVKWATCNVGATKPEEYGNYYAWGETQTKRVYSQNNYKYGTCDGDFCTLTKYCSNSSWGKNGFTDALTTLEASDDAATANWGGAWRMPTIDEWQELIDNCDWTWTDNYNGTGVAGRIVTSKANGNSIFLPAAGFRIDDDLSQRDDHGGYWSSSLRTDAPDDAWDAFFFSDTMGWSDSDRFCGNSVRPVCK